MRSNHYLKLYFKRRQMTPDRCECAGWWWTAKKRSATPPTPRVAHKLIATSTAGLISLSGYVTALNEVRGTLMMDLGNEVVAAASTLGAFTRAAAGRQSRMSRSTACAARSTTSTVSTTRSGEPIGSWLLTARLSSRD